MKRVRTAGTTITCDVCRGVIGDEPSVEIVLIDGNFLRGMEERRTHYHLYCVEDLLEEILSRKKRFAAAKGSRG